MIFFDIFSRNDKTEKKQHRDIVGLEENKEKKLHQPSNKLHQRLIAMNKNTSVAVKPNQYRVARMEIKIQKVGDQPNQPRSSIYSI